MKIKVYQIDHEKDSRNVMFMDYTFTRMHGGVNPAVYKTVFDGNVDAENLEEVFALLNTQAPVGYNGHSLSVSDIVETQDGFHFCDSFGFKKLESFDVSQAEPITGHRMLVVEPHKEPYEMVIPEGLDISYAESTEYKSFDEIEQALLAMTYETDMFDDLEDSEITVEEDAELPAEDDSEGDESDETDTPEEEPAPETDTHVFKSVEIEKNGGIFYTAYSFKAELNPQTAASEDESMIDMDIPMDDVFYMTFSIEMPAEITEASGGTVEGNKVTFEIDDITEAAEFSVNSEQSNIAAIVIIVIALVILLITFIICLNKRKNNG